MFQGQLIGIFVAPRRGIDLQPLGEVEAVRGRGLAGDRYFLKDGTYSDKDGPDSAFERELPGADVVISQPFWPAYLTAERIANAPNLTLAVTAGIGSDHVDLATGEVMGELVALVLRGVLGLEAPPAGIE